MSVTRRSVLVGGVATAGAAMLTETASAATVLAALPGNHHGLAGSRSYWLLGATGGSTARPLVIGLHGTYLTADWANRAFWSASGGWHNHAVAKGYTLALGDGVSGNWNVGGGWPSAGKDDLGYLADVVADTAARTPIDPSRVFVAGFSSGGAMAWTAAASRPDLFAACASVSGWAASYPTTPIDCWHSHGTADTTVPIRGGAGIFGYRFPPAYNEGARAPRGSRATLYPHSGGHGVPGWAAAAIWDFFTVGRARP